jgi:hypothetical protein
MMSRLKAIAFPFVPALKAPASRSEYQLAASTP